MALCKSVVRGRSQETFRPSKAMLCTADCNKAKAQPAEGLQVRLMRRCNENAEDLFGPSASRFFQSMEGPMDTKIHAPEVTGHLERPGLLFDKLDRTR